MSIIAELKRRNVFRVGAAYAIVGWLLVEVASVVLPTFKAPEWVMQVFTFLLILGLPPALILAWAFELTPEGIKREAVVDREESITRQTGRKLDFWIIALLAVALTYVVVDGYVLKSDPEPVSPVAESESASSAQEAESKEEEQQKVGDGSIAVLPFANRSVNAEDAHFVDGMHDDILTHLAKIRSLKVISRTSVMEYRDTTKNLKTIGRELGATTVLEGGVQRAGNHVRINVQLIDAETDEHLWADIYDRQLTAANIFAIQTEIATAIADALRAALSPEEERRLATVPTDNLEAYEAYLLGKQRLVNREAGSFEAAIGHFRAAVELDPDFALAYVGLADSYILHAFYSDVPREETLEKARIAAEKAISLDDQLGEAYNALAAINQDMFDYPRAEELFKRALELNPNHALTNHWYGWMLRNLLGRPEDALEFHRRAAELDPLSGAILSNVSSDLMALGRFDEAKEWIDLTIERAPAYVENEDSLGELNRLVYARLDQAIVHYRKGAAIDPTGRVYPSNLAFTYLDLGGLVEAELWARRSIREHTDPAFSNMLMYFLQLRRGNEAEALEHARKSVAASSERRSSGSAVSFLRDHELRAGRTREARALYEPHYPELMGQEPEVTRENLGAAISLAMIAMRANEPEYANWLLDRSLEILRDIPRLGSFGYGIADVLIYTIRGQSEQALAALRTAIDEDWRRSWWRGLEYDLALEPLRDDPRFQAMIEEIEADMATQLERVRELERSGELAPFPS